MRSKRALLSDALFLSPGLLVYITFMLVPLGLSFYYSLTNWSGLSPNLRFVGFRNFAILIREPMFLRSLAVTFWITILTTVGVNVVGIIAAAVLSGNRTVHRFGRTVIFIPAVLSPVVVSFIWSYMTQTNGGIINRLLALLRIPPVDLYSSRGSMVFMVSWVIAWAALGFYTTIYIANLKSIPENLYESAGIDGAGPFRQFLYISLPMLRPAIVINTITALIWGLKQFDFVKVMIPGHIQTVTIYAIERAFEYNLFGYSSAVIMILLAVTLVISLIQMRILRHGSDVYS